MNDDEVINELLARYNTPSAHEARGVDKRRDPDVDAMEAYLARTSAPKRMPELRSYDPPWYQAVPNKIGNAVDAVRGLVGAEPMGPEGRGWVNKLFGTENPLNVPGQAHEAVNHARGAYAAGDAKGVAEGLGGAALAIFAGPRAKIANMNALARAKAAKTAGLPREKIWSDEGWFQGVDGKWRFEIPDNAAAYKGFLYEKNAPLESVLSHDKLYEAYPEMRALNSDSGIGLTHGAYETGPGGPKLTFEGPNNQAITSVGLHETQHKVGKLEGFAPGGNPGQFSEQEINAELSRMQRALLDSGDPVTADHAAWLSRPDYMLYHRLAGETEARATQARQHMTPEQRRARPPWHDYDVPEEYQIVSGNAKAPMAMALPFGIGKKTSSLPLKQETKRGDLPWTMTTEDFKNWRDGQQSKYWTINARHYKPEIEALLSGGVPPRARAQAEASGMDTSRLVYRGTARRGDGFDMPRPGSNEIDGIFTTPSLHEALSYSQHDGGINAGFARSLDSPQTARMVSNDLPDASGTEIAKSVLDQGRDTVHMMHPYSSAAGSGDRWIIPLSKDAIVPAGQLSIADFLRSLPREPASASVRKETTTLAPEAISGMRDLLRPGEYPTQPGLQARIDGRGLTSSNPRVENIPVSAIVPTQPPSELSASTVMKMTREGLRPPVPGDEPWFYRHNGKYYIIDGHHRAKTAELLDLPTMTGKVWDIVPRAPEVATDILRKYRKGGPLDSHGIMNRTNEAGYEPPIMPQRAFTDDYRGTTQGLDGSLLKTDIEGRPLTAKFVAGRRRVGKDDVGLTPSEIAEIAQTLGEVNLVPRSKLGNAVGEYIPGINHISIDQGLPKDQIALALSHELGHLIADNAINPISLNGSAVAARKLYHDMRTGDTTPQMPGRFHSPEFDGYGKHQIADELRANLVSAYLHNPNTTKKMAPALASAVRASVNADPWLSKIIQFNALPPIALGAGALGVLDQYYGGEK